MNEDVYGLSLHVYYGFGMRVMYLSAPQKGGSARRPILPIRQVPLVGEVATSEETIEDLNWGISEAVTRWGVNFGEDTNANAAYHALWDDLAKRCRQPNGRAVPLRMVSFGMHCDMNKLVLLLDERAGGGWIGYVVHNEPIATLTTLSRPAVVKLAATLADKIHPLIEQKMREKPTPSTPKAGKAAGSAAASKPTADGPLSFGYKSTWIAVRSNDPQAVAQALSLRGVKPCTWKAGLDAVTSHVFVTPPLAGWVLAVGDTLPADTGPGQSDLHRAWFAGLARAFPEVMYFSTHRVVEWQAWARAVKGKVMRRFAWLGEAGATVWNEGKPTADETRLGLSFPIAGKTPILPDEDHVLALAGAWSINPMTPEQYEVGPGSGWLGKLPRLR